MQWKALKKEALVYVDTYIEELGELLIGKVGHLGV